MTFRALRWALLATVCVLVSGGATGAAADTITVAWDPSSDVGYRVHVGVQSGSYTQHVDVGSATMFAYTSAVAGQRYCFAVSAYSLSSQIEGPNSAEICGYSNQAPTLANPGNLTSTVGQPVTLQLQGSDPDSQPLTYSATGLPPGLSLMASTGFISGTGTTAGSYSVTVGAFDGVLSATPRTFSWVMTAPAGDTTPPIATLTLPTSATTYTATTLTMALGGTASDNVGVSQVRWASDRGPSGVANGTNNWSVSGIPLSAGTNIITITALDAAGNPGRDSLTVTYTAPSADTTRPAVSIGSPTTDTTYSTATSSINLGGSANDNVGVTQIRWATDRGASGVAAGTPASWSAAIPLLAGANVITVTAVDAAGNSGTDALTVTYTAPQPPSTVTLKVEAKINKRWRSTRLYWLNAPWSAVDIYRNGIFVTTTQNDGFHTDSIWSGGSYTYRICAKGSTTTCSNTATVFF